MKPTFKIDREVYEKIMFWVDKSPVEVSGLGKLLLEPSGVLRVVDAMMLPQKNGATHTDIEAEAVNKAMFELRNTQGELKFWWHSHVNMGVFWSGTDHATIREFGQGGWIAATVFNKKREMKSAYYAKDGIKTPWGVSPLFYDDCDLIVCDAFESRQAEWETEYDKNIIKVPAFTLPDYPQYGHWDSETGWNHPVPTRTKRIFSKEEIDAAIATEIKPKGMPKHTWKTLRQEASKSNLGVDAYGFTLFEWQLFAEEGWSQKQVDELIALGFVGIDLLIMVKLYWRPEEVLLMLSEGFKVADVRDELGKQKEVDDIPVADRRHIQ